MILPVTHLEVCNRTPVFCFVFTVHTIICFLCTADVIFLVVHAHFCHHVFMMSLVACNHNSLSCGQLQS